MADAARRAQADLARAQAGSITVSTAPVQLDRLAREVIDRYRGEAHEDEMVAYYPLCAFGENRVAASIDTPLHAFLPFPHVDHLHPDWAIALAASANGDKKLEEFNRTYGRRIVWLPWKRPGFELAVMLRKAVEQNPGCDGIVLGGLSSFVDCLVCRQDAAMQDALRAGFGTAPPDLPPNTAGSSAAEEGIHPGSPETYSDDPEGPTHSA